MQLTGRRAGCPLLRFVGKEGHILDHVGEKSNERHEQQSLGDLRNELSPTFVRLACDAAHGRHAYTLLVEAPGCPDTLLRKPGYALEQELACTFLYRYCRELGQLGVAVGLCCGVEA